MSPLERLLGAVPLVIGLLAGGWFGVHRYGEAQFEAGQAAAVAAGEKLRQAEAERNRETEANLRGQLYARDIDAHEKEQTYAEKLEAAQRRVRAGVNSLRCPAASPVQPATAAGDRPAATGPAPDGQGAEFMPDAASAFLGDAAAVAGIVRKFDRLEQRFEACRAMNAVP